MAEANYQTPVYVTDENFKPGIVQVILDIPNLKPFKKNQPNAKNANVIYEFHTRSMCITINGNKGKLQNKNYQLDIKRLPGDIEENTSHIKNHLYCTMRRAVGEHSQYPSSEIANVRARG
ncbi:uncharacterized protein LOC106872334 isoform X2 [Octopus bimaculoides]|uniref:uncharacterized protein LOC106872334 isoform X2 n=1 Tax=Octopus bimaculoides TaxID=37653 RepID=UPI00071D1335|nr:uncharacterized protein LOC106872334 isoform X2 [Octopus bimaculoides]|eukprot:XP_014774767.1 PREDICTED: uncharacterized protein LOC106872334 isoform X2 [Octopus bimaculoides]